MGLLDAPVLKPIVDGKTLAKELDTRPGPWMKAALDEVMAWQLQHPDDATAEGAIEAIRTMHGELPSRLITHFLTLTIRPLFAQSKTQSESQVTQQGRRTLNSNVGRTMHSRSRGVAETSEQARESRPWKMIQNENCLQLLDWCIKALHPEPQRTDEHWPLLLPPTLALVDDVEVRFKSRGCNMLTQLLQATSPAFLHKTGLGQVFQDAITPCLSYLPTLTPEGESVQMLNAAYPAIIQLANVRYPRAAQQQWTVTMAARERALTHILHHHLIRSFAHVEPQDYPTLTSALLQRMSSVVNEIGIGITAQLPHILPVIVAILSCSEGLYLPELHCEAVSCLQNIIAHAWPRIWQWRVDVMKGVCIAWQRLSQADAGDGGTDFVRSVDATKVVLRKVPQMLHAVAESRPRSENCLKTWNDEQRKLIEADGSLQALFAGNRS